MGHLGPYSQIGMKGLFLCCMTIATYEVLLNKIVFRNASLLWSNNQQCGLELTAESAVRLMLLLNGSTGWRGRVASSCSWYLIATSKGQKAWTTLSNRTSEQRLGNLLMLCSDVVHVTFLPLSRSLFLAETPSFLTAIQLLKCAGVPKPFYSRVT